MKGQKQRLYMIFYLLAGMLFFLPVAACRKNSDETHPPRAETAQDWPQIRANRLKLRSDQAERYLADLQVVGSRRGEAAFERDLLQVIEKNEQRIDAETGFLWGSHTQPKGYHSRFEYGTKVRPTREATYHAAMLIASPREEHREKGRQLLEKVIGLQDRNPESDTFGLWPWYYEEPLSEMAAPDFNWADFLGAVLATLLHDYPDRLPPELLEKTRRSLECCTGAIIKRDVKPNYTNIAMMGAAVTAAAGELLDRNDLLDYGRMRILRNLEHNRKTGNFIEYNSPNYTPVVINELERMLHLVDDPACRQAAAELLISAWETVAEHYHVPTRQWAGPFSRTYSDTISPRMRNTILAQALVLSADEAAALPTDDQPVFSPFVPRLACPESLRRKFSEIPRAEIQRRHVFIKADADNSISGTTWLTPDSALGSASYHTFWEQARGLIAYWVVPDSDEPAVLKLSFLHDGNDFAGACARNRQSGGRVLSAIGLLKNQGSMHPTFDRPKDGVFNAESFEIVYRLKAKNARARELSPCVFELSAGPVRAILHVAECCMFDGRPVQWHLEHGDGMADIVKLVGECYRGESKAFAFDSLGETRIGVGLELLHVDQRPSHKVVTLSDAQALPNREGTYYRTGWEPVTGDKGIVAPTLPTDR